MNTNLTSYAHEHNPPALQEGDSIIFDEPGRILTGARTPVDCRSRHFQVARTRLEGYQLRVKHGGGEEEFSLCHSDRIIDALKLLDSDSRYWILNAFVNAGNNAARGAENKANAHWQQAAAEKRIKTRKINGKNEVKVWIEEPVTAIPAV